MGLRMLLWRMWYTQKIRIVNRSGEVLFTGTNNQTRSIEFRPLLDRLVLSYGYNGEEIEIKID